MNKNLICFALLLVGLFTASFFVKDPLYLNYYPWHMTPWENPDSLSVNYIQKYEVLKDSDSVAVAVDFERAVFILVDAWGLPLEEPLLNDDLSVFGDVKTFIHKRKRNQTKWVELLELKNRTKGGIFFFGGDSLEYDRKSYLPEIGFKKMVFCQNCPDETMIDKLDSVLSVENEVNVFAWTTQSSRDGNREHLRKSLKLIADLAGKHSNVRFVVQGTHRPTLDSPETRKKYYAHWVPVVILN